MKKRTPQVSYRSRPLRARLKQVLFPGHDEDDELAIQAAYADAAQQEDWKRRWREWMRELARREKDKDDKAREAFECLCVLLSMMDNHEAEITDLKETVMIIADKRRAAPNCPDTLNALRNVAARALEESKKLKGTVEHRKRLKHHIRRIDERLDDAPYGRPELAA